MRLREIIQQKRQLIIDVAARHGARDVRVFGSVARGEERDDSDVDFVVELEPGRSLLDHAGLQLDLQQALGCRVDVVTYKGLKPAIRDQVLKEAVAL
jgi:predicted nucleotidyltransferase